MRSVSDADFVRAWEGSECIDDVVRQTGQARSTVQARANKLRARGKGCKENAYYTAFERPVGHESG